MCWAVGIAHVGLNGDDINVVGIFERGSHLRGRFGRGVGGVAQDKGCAFLCEIPSNCSTDSWISRINKNSEEAGDRSGMYLASLLSQWLIYHLKAFLHWPLSDLWTRRADSQDEETWGTLYLARSFGERLYSEDADNKLPHNTRSTKIGSEVADFCWKTVAVEDLDL